MHVQYFPNCPLPNHPPNARTHRLGISGNTIYLFIESHHFFEFYAIDVRFPRKWHAIGTLDRADLSYAFATLTPNARYIYVLVLRLTNDVEFAVKRFDILTREETMFNYQVVEDLFRVFEVPLDHIKIRCGDDGQIVLYDRTIVQGEIPFWTLRLNEQLKTFSVLKNSIGTNGVEAEVNSSLFPIAFDPLNRVFAKLMGPRKMLVYTEERKKWVEYVLPPEDTLYDLFGSDGFPVEDNRGIRETFGTHGHRVGAMQTRLTFHDMDGDVVARVLHNDKLHTTATVELVHGKREIKVRKLATFSLDESVSRMFYLIASRDFHAFLGVRESAIVFIRSPTLEEIVGWKLQKMLILKGFEKDVAQVSNYTQLVALAFAKFSGEGKDENISKHLENLGIKETGPELTVIEFDLD